MSVESVQAAQEARQAHVIGRFREFQQMREDMGVPADGTRYELLGVILYALAQLINNDGPNRDFKNPF